MRRQGPAAPTERRALRDEIKPRSEIKVFIEALTATCAATPPIKANAPSTQMVRAFHQLPG